MGRPRNELPAPSSLPRAILQTLRREGADALAIARRVGIDEAAIDKSPIDVTPSALRELFEEGSVALGEPFLALRMATELPAHDYGFAEMLARAAATVGDAAAELARYAALVHPELECTFERTPSGMEWRARSPSRPRDLGRHAHEYGLAYVLVMARLGAEANVAPSRVWFAHARPPDITPLFRFFGTRDIAFGEAESGMALSLEAADLPMRGQDARLSAAARGLADEALSAHPRRTTFADHVAKHVLTGLADGAEMNAVARALRMSQRTLQRRLEDEGTAYSEVVDAVRQEVARKSLREPTLTLAEVAFRCGFSDLATFSRAFKRWTGMPPGMWRGR